MAKLNSGQKETTNLAKKESSRKQTFRVKFNSEGKIVPAKNKSDLSLKDRLPGFKGSNAEIIPSDPIMIMENSSHPHKRK